jgi:hypothetical protein
MKMEQRQKAINKQLELNEEEKAIVDRNIANVGDFQLDTRGLIPLNSYIKIHMAFLKQGFEMKESLNAAHVAKRRALLKEGDNAGYEKEIAEFMMGLRTKTMGM